MHKLDRFMNENKSFLFETDWRRGVEFQNFHQKNLSGSKI